MQQEDQGRGMAQFLVPLGFFRCHVKREVLSVRRMWHLTYAFDYWMFDRVRPLAYGEEYIDPKYPWLKIPIHIFEIAVIIPCLVIDSVLIPVYAICRQRDTLGPHSTSESSVA
jgi:hypothetical protein